MVQKIKWTPDPAYYINKEFFLKKEIKGEYFLCIDKIKLI